MTVSVNSSNVPDVEEVYEPSMKTFSRFNFHFTIIFVIINILLIFYHYVFTTANGEISTWGNTFETFFGLTNTMSFYVFSILGNGIILLSSIFSLPTARKLQTHSTSFHKKGQVVGILLIFFGFISYFGFNILEPFLITYLLIIFTFFKLISLAIQPDYLGFKSGIDLMAWDGRTKEVLYNYHSTAGDKIIGDFDVAMFLLVILFFILLYVIVRNTSSLLSQNTVTKFSSVTAIQWNLKIQDNILFVFTGLLVHIFFSYLYLAFIPNSLISFFILLLGFPVFKTKVFRKTLFQNNSIWGNILDIYLLIILIVNTFFSFFNNTDVIRTFSFTLIFVVLVLSITKIELYISLRRSEGVAFEEKINEIGFTLGSFGNLLLFYAFAIYFGLWISKASYFLFNTILINETFGLNIFIIALLIRYGSHIIRTIGNPFLIKYALRRMIVMVPMFIGITMVIYGIMTATGNPVDLILAGKNCGANLGCISQAREILELRFGINAPVPVQWFNWLFQFILGSLGQELVVGTQSVAKAIVEKSIPTLEIALIPITLSVLISIPLGIAAAKRQYSWIDNGIAIFVAVGVAIPIFFFIIVFILIFAGILSILPSFGRSLLAERENISLVYVRWFEDGIPIALDFGPYNILGITIPRINLDSGIIIPINNFIQWERWDWIFHMIIPVIAITLLQLALYTRLVRSGMLEVLRQDYIMSARASGFSEKAIVNKFALRNVLIPVITFLGLSVGTILGGAPITETVIAWPGLGVYSVIAIQRSDYSVIMATTMLVALMIMLANLLTDILYSIVDPRIRID